MSRTIVIATTNAGKVAEIRAALAAVGSDFCWIGLREAGAPDAVEEDGATFADNARKKALGYAAACGLWTLADDSGLVVDALGGLPGVASARYAAERWPQNADNKTKDRLNYEKLLAALADTPPSRRAARFCCHLCLASPQRILLETTGAVEGVILDAPRGDNGFGYDPVFFIPALGKTAAELDLETKNRISHRGQALAELARRLAELRA